MSLIKALDLVMTGPVEGSDERGAYPNDEVVSTRERL